MAAPTQTDICNAVLAVLGSGERINSINDTQSDHARRFKAIWDMVLRELLEDHPYNFALHRAVLNASAEAPVSGYVRKFALPADCLRWLPPARGDAEWFIGEQEGDFILTDAEAVTVRYVRLATDTGRWPASFARAMRYALAAELAEAVTQSQSVADRMAEKAEHARMKAKRADARSTGRRSRARPAASSDWIAARQRTYGAR